MNAKGQKFTYAESTRGSLHARPRVFGLLGEVLATPRSARVFAYDLNEPDLCTILITLAKQGRIRVISTLPRSITNDAEAEVRRRISSSALHGGGRRAGRDHARQVLALAHDKVFIVSNAAGAMKVLTGSTNFSIHRFYVNSNHVLVFDDAGVRRCTGRCSRRCGAIT